MNTQLNKPKKLTVKLSPPIDKVIKVEKAIGQSIPPSDKLLVYDTELQMWVEVEDVVIDGGTF